MEIEAPTAELANAALWFAQTLNIAMYKGVSLEIHYIEDTEGYGNASGWIEYGDNHGDIFVRRHYENPREDQIEILAHEMVHFKQYVTGELREAPNGTYWKGQLQEITDCSETWAYWNSPWELEAFGRQQGLEYMYKASLEPISKSLEQKILELFAK